MFKSILVAIDLEDPTSWSRVVPIVLPLARSSGARLTLATVITQHSLDQQWSPAAYRENIELARVRLCSLADTCGDLPSEVVVADGRVGPEILELARGAEADLIVIASHPPGLRDYVLGGNASYIVSRASCSVLVVRE